MYVYIYMLSVAEKNVQSLLHTHLRTPDRMTKQVIFLAKGFFPAPLIGYSQLTIIPNGRSPIRNMGSRWTGVIINTSPPQFKLSRIASDIAEEMWADDPTGTEFYTWSKLDMVR